MQEDPSGCPHRCINRYRQITGGLVLRVAKGPVPDVVRQPSGARPPSRPIPGLISRNAGDLVDLHPGQAPMKNWHRTCATSTLRRPQVVCIHLRWASSIGLARFRANPIGAWATQGCLAGIDLTGERMSRDELLSIPAAAAGGGRRPAFRKADRPARIGGNEVARRYPLTAGFPRATKPSTPGAGRGRAAAPSPLSTISRVYRRYPHYRWGCQRVGSSPTHPTRVSVPKASLGEMGRLVVNGPMD
jgi:hypothetical protein